MCSHTGRSAQVQQVLLDEQGRLYLQTDIGMGLVHSLDVGTAADALETGDWGGAAVQDVQSRELERLGNFVREPG